MVVYNHKTSYTKLLNIKPRTGLALFKSLATHVWAFVFKIKNDLTLARDMVKNVGIQGTLSQSPRSYVPFGNLGCLAKSFLYGQIRSQTLMKKLLSVFLLFFLLVPSLSFASKKVTVKKVYPLGCTSTIGYSPVTGKKCDGIVNVFPIGCISLNGFSITTGHSCSEATIENNIANVELPQPQISDIVVNSTIPIPNAADSLMTIDDVSKIKPSVKTTSENITLPLSSNNSSTTVSSPPSIIQPTTPSAPVLTLKSPDCQLQYDNSVDQINSNELSIKSQIVQIDTIIKNIGEQYAANGAAYSGFRTQAQQPYSDKKIALEQIITLDEQSLETLKSTLQSCLSSINNKDSQPSSPLKRGISTANTASA